MTAAQAVYWLPKAFGAWRRRQRRTAPRDVIERRKRVRQEILEHVKGLEEGERLEVIIRDIARLGEFPDIDERRRGISAWFKLDIRGLYHQGIEVVLSHARKAVPLVDDNDFMRGWRFLEEGEEVPDYAVTAWPVGRIPFDFIESIDWHPDEFSGSPHFYCRFSGPFGEPYEDVIYKGRLYPEVSKMIHEMQGLRDERFGWGRIRRRLHNAGWWFRARIPKRLRPH